ARCNRAQFSDRTVKQRRCDSQDIVWEDHVQHEMGASFTLPFREASLEPGSHPIIPSSGIVSV
ncbi:hypothetical protein M5D96_001341, partial [Drosophila gunungcola]